ncbi:hypothetical protein SAMN06265337_3275 [Hymenobacter gelipurpurascens]|uniref:Uncharacterized protein n=1 Tax=Hymenobacter gelipurpurascens TaxID=89968 RepID=A0A212UD99_9BACT|nr:hypothetical protein SAMN06265337_3275 [Hymenobacter gelipurpurascens]
MTCFMVFSILTQSKFAAFYLFLTNWQKAANRML